MPAVFRLQTFGRLQLLGPEGEVLPRRRKELALLVLLAERGARGLRREQLQAMLWGERDEEKSRNSLRQALLRLRRALGESAIEFTGDEVRLVPGVVDYDVRAFEAAVAADVWEDAAALHAGEFLVACEDVGGEEFRIWLDVERARLRKLLEAAHASAFNGSVDAERQLRVATRWASDFPLDAEAQLAQITALSGAGRVGDALSVRTAYERRLDQELDREPAAKWWYATEEVLRAAREREPARVAAATSPPNDAVESPAPVSLPAERGSRAWRYVLATLVVVIALGAIVFIVRGNDVPVLAVGHVRIAAVADSFSAVPLLIETNLGRARGVRVLSESRMREVLMRFSADRDSAALLQRVARAAGADQVLEGVLSQRASGLRLDLRRIDLGSGAILESYSVENRDIFDLIDDATDQIALSLGGQRATVRMHGSTTSLVAYRLYEKGLRAFYNGELDAALPLFRAAVEEDSAFAMAWYFMARSGLSDLHANLDRARELSDRLPDRERLVIATNWASAMNEPARLAIAETLATRYAGEPDAHLEYGNALVAAGRFLEAASQLRRVVQLDSLGLTGASPRCPSCEAYVGLMGSYALADSLPAAEAVVREWIARVAGAPAPRRAQAMRALATLYTSQGRYDEMLAANQAAARLAGGDENWRSDFWLRAGDFEKADEIWQRLLSTGNERDLELGLDHAVGSLRIQGRHREALEAARRIRAISDDSLSSAYHEAIVLFEMGRYREAALIFDSLGMHRPAERRSNNGRYRAWSLTQSATAHAALGDTVRLRMLVDTVRVQGSYSGFRRDQLLYHYVRGLLLRARGNHAAAADAFRQSMYSPADGNVRAPYELAGSLLQLGRASEAIPVLRKALGGPIGASGTYINRSEIVFRLAQAHERAGNADSARVHYRWAAHAWRNAEGSYRDRRAALCRQWDVCDEQRVKPR